MANAPSEPAAPQRFAQVRGAAMSTTVTVLLFAAPATGRPALATGGDAAVVLMACWPVSPVSAPSVGCRMYRQVAFLRRLNVN
jgi:hypothetical protein